MTSGTSAFSVQATDSAGNKTTKAFSIQIQPAPVQITTPSLAASTVGANYGQTLTATGGSPPYTWSLSSGSLPSGLALESAGAIRGAAQAAGIYTFSLQAVDVAGASTAKAYALTVNGAVSIQTNSLADALIGASYSQQLRATGGTPPYTWSLNSGALPDGIKLDASGGTLTGTPTVVGSFSFTLRAVDSVSAYADHQFQITTAAGLIITSAPVLAPATVGLRYGQSLDAAGGKAAVCMVDQQRRFAGGHDAGRGDGRAGRHTGGGRLFPIHGECKRRPGAHGQQTIQSPGGCGAHDLIGAGVAAGHCGVNVFPGAGGDRRNAAVSCGASLRADFRPGSPSMPERLPSRAFPRWVEALRLRCRSRTTTPSRHPNSSRSR